MHRLLLVSSINQWPCSALTCFHLACPESSFCPLIPPLLPLVASRPKTEAERLALENERMEARLQELKASLRAQKGERDTRGGYSWRSGREGRLRGHAAAVLDDNSTRRLNARRMKVLPPTPDAMQRAAAATTNSIASAASMGSAGSSGSSRSAVTASSALGGTPPRERVGKENASGGFDEVASHNSFLEALNEWRTGEYVCLGGRRGSEKKRREGRSRAKGCFCQDLAQNPSPLSLLLFSSTPSPSAHKLPPSRHPLANAVLRM